MNRFLLLLALWGFLASSCSIYKVEIRQGNEYTFDKIDMLEPGNTREAVRSLLGPAHHIGEYRPNRWHYFDYNRTAEPTSGLRRLTLEFDDRGVLAEIIVEEAQVENDY